MIARDAKKRSDAVDVDAGLVECSSERSTLVARLVRVAYSMVWQAAPGRKQVRFGLLRDRQTPQYQQLQHRGDMMHSTKRS